MPRPIATKAVGTDAFVIPGLLDGRPADLLTLGKTTLDEALATFPSPEGTDGQTRPTELELAVGDHPLVANTVYNPGVFYMLYFDANGILVLFVDGTGFSSGKTVQDLIGEYPGLQMTHDEPNWSEMQTELADCVTLVVAFGPSRKLDSMGYAYTCPTS
jgi:hypothetical protein